MFPAIFTFLLLTVYAAEELPSYVYVCGRNDPNYSQCITDNINNLKSMICTGMPEFNVLPSEPMIIDKIVVFDTDNLKLNLEDIKITGICDFILKSSYVTPDKFGFEFNFLVKHLNLDSTYNVDIRLLVPISNKGLVYIFTDNLEGKLTVNLKEITKNDKKQIYVSKINTMFDVVTVDYELKSDKDLGELREVFENMISENKKDMITKIKPILEEKLSKLIMSVFNNVTHNRFEQLFPDEKP